MLDTFTWHTDAISSWWARGSKMLIMFKVKESQWLPNPVHLPPEPFTLIQIFSKRPNSYYPCSYLLFSYFSLHCLTPIRSKPRWVSPSILFPFFTFCRLKYLYLFKYDQLKNVITPYSQNLLHCTYHIYWSLMIIHVLLSTHNTL